MNLTGNIYRTNPSGGSGTSDYRDLTNLPTINGVTISGDLASEELKLVQAETGKGLSSNDFTDALKEKAETAIDGVLVDGVKTTTITLPKNTSDLTNDSGFQTAEQVTEVLKSYATKEQIPDVSNFATKQEIPDVTNFATKQEIPDVSGYALKTEIPNIDGKANAADVERDYLKTETYNAEKQVMEKQIESLQGTINGLINGDEVSY